MEWGHVPLSTGTPGARSSLFVVHHPGGFAKHISLGRCQTSDPAIRGDDVLHICDTLGGSSGAPIFDNNSRKVIGLHYSAVGLRDLNAGKRIASLAKNSKIIARILTDAVPKPKPLARPPMSEAARFWAEVKHSKNQAVLEEFIKRFANSFYATLAKARLDELKTQTIANVSKTDPIPPVAEISKLVMDLKELTRQLQTELKRVGCDPGKIDGEWGAKGRIALSQFNKHAKLELFLDEPRKETIDAIKSKQGRICPVPSGSGTASASSQACSENPIGPAPDHCCKLVLQQVAEYERIRSITSDATYQRILAIGIKTNRGWYNAHCR